MDSVMRKMATICVGLLIATFITSACSSSSGSDSSRAGAVVSECDGQPIKDLGTGSVCVDSGVRSESLFSFSNWGGRRYKADDFGFEEMIALYGENEVCKSSTSDKCDIAPKARLMRNVIDSMIQNGRCEGITALGASYMIQRGPDPKLFGAGNIQELIPSTDSFANVVDYWWGTQLLSDVVKESKSTRGKDLKKVLSEIIAGVSAKQGVTIGLYTDGGAHSVLPVAVTKISDTEFIVHVWDSNTPRALSKLKIDLSKDEWIYAAGRVNTNSAPKKWTGQSGSIDIVTLANRKGKPVLNINDGQKGSASITASSTSGRELTLSLSTKAGKQLVATATGTVGVIPGVVVTPMRNGDTSQLIVSLPTDQQDLLVEVSSSSEKKQDGATLVTFDNGDSRAMSLSIPNTQGESLAKVALSRSNTDEMTVGANSREELTITTANKFALMSIPTQSNETASFSLPGDNSSDVSVSLTSATGKVHQVNIPTTRDESQDVVVLRKEDGSLFTVSKPLAPVEIDDSALATLRSQSTNQQGQDIVRIDEEASSFAEQTSVTMMVGQVGETFAEISSRVTNEIDVATWIEYGPDDNWAEVLTTNRQSVESSVGSEMNETLTKLQPGTTYRFRRVFAAGERLAYSPYSIFTTNGAPPSLDNQVVPDGSIKISASLVASTATGGVVASRISTPVSASAWIEYSSLINPTLSFTTTPERVRKGQDVLSVLLMNGLTTGQPYRYRVVVKTGNSFGYSQYLQMTTGETIAASRISTAAIGATSRFTVSGISQTNAIIEAVLSSGTSGRVLVEYTKGPKSGNARTKPLTFTSGKNQKVTIPLSGLSASTRYSARLIVVAGSVTMYGSYRTFTTLPTDEADTSGGRLSGVVVPTNLLERDSAAFQVVVRSQESGSLLFEYGIDNPNGLLYTTAATAVSAGETLVGPIATNPIFRPGTPYRVRAVLSVGSSTFKTSFTRFVTAGTLDVSSYRATAPGLRRTADGVEVTWSVPVPDVPSAITYRVLESNSVLCTTQALVFECDADITTQGVKNILVATLLNGAEIARSPISSITIGGTPTVTSFSSVSTTTSGATFTFSFNPSGETVQYGIEVRTAQDQFVKADLIGQTSQVVNGAVFQVGGLSSTTQYRARLVLVYGTVTVASSWVTITTG